MKKSILNIVVIALVVSVIGTLAASFLFNQAVYASPSVTPKNANECTLDNSCEVNAISSRTGEILLSGDTHITGNLLIDGMFSNDCEVVSYSGGNGDEVCQTRGYDYCLIGEGRESTTYYDSTNRSCSGKKQFELRTAILVSCPNDGGSGDYGCGTNTNGAEPLYGDISTSDDSTPMRLVCCR